MAGVDDRFKVAVPVYGCGFLHDNSAWLNIFAQLPQEDKKVWIEQFDPSKYLAGCRMPILFMNGTNDFAYPLDSYQKSYRLVPERLRNISVTIRMPHSHPDGWAPKEIGIFVDSILKGSQPLARFGSVTVRDRQVNARIQGIVPIKEASLHYTTDTCSWKDRQWQTIPAEITKDGQLIQTTLPAKTPCVYFLTARDERDAVVSTEHAEFK